MKQPSVASEEEIPENIEGGMNPGKADQNQVYIPGLDNEKDQIPTKKPFQNQRQKTFNENRNNQNKNQQINKNKTLNQKKKQNKNQNLNKINIQEQTPTPNLTPNQNEVINPIPINVQSNEQAKDSPNADNGKRKKKNNSMRSNQNIQINQLTPQELTDENLNRVNPLKASNTLPSSKSAFTYHYEDYFIVWDKFLTKLIWDSFKKISIFLIFDVICKFSKKITKNYKKNICYFWPCFLLVSEWGKTYMKKSASFICECIKCSACVICGAHAECQEGIDEAEAKEHAHIEHHYTEYVQDGVVVGDDRASRHAANEQVSCWCRLAGIVFFTWVFLAFLWLNIIMLMFSVIIFMGFGYLGPLVFIGFEIIFVTFGIGILIFLSAVGLPVVCFLMLITFGMAILLINIGIGLILMGVYPGKFFAYIIYCINPTACSCSIKEYVEYQAPEQPKWLSEPLEIKVDPDPEPEPELPMNNEVNVIGNDANPDNGAISSEKGETTPKKPENVVSIPENVASNSENAVSNPENVENTNCPINVNNNDINVNNDQNCIINVENKEENIEGMINKPQVEESIVDNIVYVEQNYETNEGLAAPEIQNPQEPNIDPINVNELPDN